MPSFQKPPTLNDDHRAQDIYRKAASIIHEKGFDATSMGDIAEAVDLTKGGLYYYIKGKKALLYAIMNFAMDLLDHEVLSHANEETDPQSRLSILVAGHIRLMIREPCAMTILVHEDEGLDEDHRLQIRQRKDEFPAILQQTIREMLAQNGHGQLIDPKIAAHSLLGMIHWISRWYQPDDNTSSEDDVVHQLTHLALHGLLPPTHA